MDIARACALLDALHGITSFVRLRRTAMESS